MTSFSRGNKMQILGAVIIAVIGVIMLGVGISYDLRYARYEEITATIVDVDYHLDGDGDYLVSYTYEYTVNGQTFRRKSNSSTSENIAHRIGDRVTIKYDPQNPNKIIESFWVCVLFTGVGALFVVLSVVVVLYTIYRHRKYAKISTADYGNESVEDLQIDENGDVIISDAEGNIITADGVIPASGAKEQTDAEDGKLNDVNDVFDI